MNAGAAGISEQVQEVFTFAHLAQHTTRDTVIEEQTGVQIVCQVHPQARIVFAHLDKVALIAHFLILIGPFLTLTGLQDQFVRRNAHHANCRRDDVQQTLARFLGINGFRRSVFLHHDPVRITVYRNVIFRQIGIVNAIAFNAFLFRPFFEFLQILTQTVSVVFRHCRWLAVAIFLGQMVVFLYAVQRAVFGFELTLGAELEAAQQLRRTAKQRQIPAAEIIFHGATQQTVQRNQRRFAIETFAVRRVTDHRTVRAFRQRVG
ncbi:hypothetical protein D3C72_1509300 [compost metagenome]